MRKEKEIYEGIKDKYLKRRDINGVSYGRKIVQNKTVDDICVSFYVSKKLPSVQLTKKEKIPKTIQGIKTDVIEAIIKPLVITPYSGDSYKYVVAPGISIGPECASYKLGTLGGLVYNNDTGNIGILSNHHVLVDKNSSSNPFIMQPGSSIPSENRIAETFLNKMYLGTRGDYAFAELLGLRDYDLKAYGTGIQILSARDPLIDEVIKKVGRTTGITQSKVAGFGTFTVDYSSVYLDGWYGSVSITGFTSVPLVDPYENISAEGDSGSIWYLEDSKQAVGILTGGTADGLPEICFSSYITNAIIDLGISFDLKTSMWLGSDSSNLFTVLTPKWILGQESTQLELKFTPPFDMDDICLFTDVDYIDSSEGGAVWVKRTTDSFYMPVGASSLYPTCYLGNMKANIPVSLDVIIKNTNNLSLAGDYVIPLYIGQSANSSGILTNEFIS